MVAGRIARLTVGPCSKDRARQVTLKALDGDTGAITSITLPALQQCQ